MSSDIIPVHLFSALAAEDWALNSAGGLMAAYGHEIMSSDIIPVHLFSALAAENWALNSAGGLMAAYGHEIMSGGRKFKMR